MTELQKKQILKMRRNGCGYKTVASALGLSRDSVRLFCKSRNMAGFGKVAAMNINEQTKNGNICLNCCKPVEQPIRGRPKKFCSEECRREWWKIHPEEINRKETALYKLKCSYCGKEFISYGNKGRKFCSHNCYIHQRFYESEENKK